MAKKLSLLLGILLFLPTAALAQDIVHIKAGKTAPFDGVLLSVEAAAKILNQKEVGEAECDLRVEYELKLQEEKLNLLLGFKDIELVSAKDKYESMMILKAAELQRLEKLILQQKPDTGPFMVALGFGIGTATSLGIFAASVQVAK
jgi:hypothetical protein